MLTRSPSMVIPPKLKGRELEPPKGMKRSRRDRPPLRCSCPLPSAPVWAPWSKDWSQGAGHLHVIGTWDASVVYPDGNSSRSEEAVVPLPHRLFRSLAPPAGVYCRSADLLELRLGVGLIAVLRSGVVLRIRFRDGAPDAVPLIFGGKLPVDDLLVTGRSVMRRRR